MESVQKVERQSRLSTHQRLTIEEVAAIRAWALGPGAFYNVSEQSRRLAKGIEGWFLNPAAVTPITIRQLLMKESWPGVKPDYSKLQQWQATVTNRQRLS